MGTQEWLAREEISATRIELDAWEHWFVSLSQKHRHDFVRMLDVARAIFQFANPIHHPGPLNQVAVEQRDFRLELSTCVEALRYVGELLSGLESHRVAETRPWRHSPLTWIQRLETTFKDFGVLAQGMLSGGVSHAHYAAWHRTFRNELENNALVQSNLDRVLTTQESSKNRAKEPAADRHVVRILRIVRREAESLTRMTESLSPTLSWMLFSGVQGEVLSVAGPLRLAARSAMATRFEDLLFQMPAQQLHDSGDELYLQARSLQGMREIIDHVAASLPVEVRGVLDEVPPLEKTEREWADEQIVQIAIRLQTALRYSIKAIEGELYNTASMDIESDPPLLIERLRRDAWIVTRILQAFIAKVQAISDTSHNWNAPSAETSVMEFLHHFRTFGRPLARETRYAYVEELLEAVRSLEAGHPPSSTIGPLLTFYQHLEEFIQELGNHPRLERSPLDRKSAAEWLKNYLMNSSVATSGTVLESAPAR